MKKANGEEVGSNSMDRISDLPEHILQRILYFMSQKEAVRTSLLSKSWGSIWCTRPNLDLSDNNFKEKKQEFLSTVGENLQRYSDQKMCLEEFGLSMFLGNSDQESVSLLKKWIPALKNMGVKDFRLSIYSKSIQRRRRRRVKLPSVVFEAESLQDLHAEGFTLGRTAIRIRNILSKHLKKLHLEKVKFEDGVFQKIISSCPLIETMILKSCGSIGIYPSKSLVKIHIEYGDVSFHKGAEEFCNLNYLFLNQVMLSSLDNFSSCKFPSLNDLTFFYCDGLKESHLFIDAPNINSFVYYGFIVPSFSFSTTSREWRSTLHMVLRDDPSLWLLKLRKLLESLSRSEISLTISQYQINAEDIFKETRDLVQEFKDGNKAAVVVKKLILLGDLSYFLPLSNGLFSICRPRTIGQVNYTNSESVMKKLMQGEGVNQDELRQLWLPDLEEVSLEIYDNNRREWDPTSLSDLPDYEEGKRISTRFTLKWREIL